MRRSRELALVVALVAVSASVAAPTSLPVATRVTLLFGDNGPATDCATPELLALRRAGSSQPVPLLAEPPALPDPQTWVAPEGFVTVHFTTSRGSTDSIAASDRNNNGIADYVEAVASGITETLQWAERAGLAPDTPRSARLDVYLANLGGRLSGYLVARPRPERGAEFIVIDSRLTLDETLLRAVSGHQAAHAILAGYDLDAPSWWHEATAAYIEIASQHSILRYEESLSALLATPERGLLADSLAAGRGGLLWVTYLVESSGGTEILRQIWEDISSGPEPNALDSIDRVLALRGGSLEKAFSDFTLWNLFTGTRDDGRHYPYGAMLPDPSFGASHQTYPAIDLAPGRAVQPLGWSLVRFEPDGTGGGLSISFEGDEPGQWEADLLLAGRGGRLQKSLRRVPMVLDRSGRGALSVPWDGAIEALLVVRNVRTSGAAAGFSYSVRNDPAFPFELASLAAEAEGGPGERAVRLVWETESEDGLVGWQVYRSTGRGEFVRVSDVDIPAVGGDDGAVTYQFLDSGVRPSTLYQYYVLGLTTEGLTQRSFIVTLRLPQ